MTEKSLEQQFIEAPDFIKQQAIADGIKKLADEGLVKPLPDGSQLQEVVPGLVWVVTTIEEN